jgi:hypothetical protein
MRILVAARRLAADRTSEGICSSKYVAALVAAGHDVSCITSEDTTDVLQNEWQARWAPITHTDSVASKGMSTALARLTARMAARGPMGAYSSRKLQGVSKRATGYSVQTWADVAAWRSAVRSSIESAQPAAVVVRGAGREFEPHIAMLGWQPSVPWIAHYHDPYPGSLYPEPYRQYVALQSPRQERIHRRIIQAADALTFPSQRLLDWVLRGDLEGERRKAFVVPHMAGDPIPTVATGTVNVPLEEDHLNIVHTGTLLRERDPRSMLRGFLNFVDQGDERRRLARLILVGRVDRAHTNSNEWATLTRRGLLRCIDHRVSYRCALAVSRRANCLMILEANTKDSPFFPAKLADYLWLGKPIIAVSPEASATADILGRDYALRVPPSDSAVAATVFERVWNAWREGALERLAPPRSLAESMSEAAVGRCMNGVFEFAFNARRSQVA